MSEVVKSVLFRLLRGFIAGFVGAAATVTLAGLSTWGDLASALNSLTLAGVAGGITGLLLAADKYLRAE
jgi:hypothetical protein